MKVGDFFILTFLKTEEIIEAVGRDVAGMRVTTGVMKLMTPLFLTWLKCAEVERHSNPIPRFCHFCCKQEVEPYTILIIKK